jgi:hypothetical protein
MLFAIRASGSLRALEEERAAHQDYVCGRVSAFLARRQILPRRGNRRFTWERFIGKKCGVLSLKRLRRPPLCVDAGDRHVAVGKLDGETAQPSGPILDTGAKLPDPCRCRHAVTCARAMFANMGNTSSPPTVRLLMVRSSSAPIASTSAERASGLMRMKEETEVAAPATVSCTKRSGSRS